MKAKHRRIYAFDLWCWRRVLRVPWIARRSNQSILKEINPEYFLEGLMLKLKLKYFDHLIQRTNSLEKILMLGKTEDRRRRGQDEMVGWHHRLSGYEYEQAPWDSEWQGILPCCSPWVAKVRHNWATEQQVILNFNSQSMLISMFTSLRLHKSIFPSTLLGSSTEAL